MKTLYVTDLDGTLLNTKDHVSEYSIRTINRLMEKGMLFTYATARSLVSASVVDSIYEGRTRKSNRNHKK